MGHKEIHEITSVHFWQWRGERIAYRASGPDGGPALILLHGFALSSLHFRRTMPALAGDGYRVYAIDLLGFGESAKPLCNYSTELWEELVADFCDAFVPRQPVVIVGNSIGALVAMKVAASLWGCGLRRVKRLVLLNCAGGMNSKGTLVNSSVPLPIRFVLFPVFALLDGILNALGGLVFARLCERNNLVDALRGLYVNEAAVDDELVDGVLAPAAVENSCAVFVRVLTGDPGEIPENLMPQINCPTLCLWGDQDGTTPLWGEVGQLLQRMASDPTEPHVSLQVVPGSGHFLHDDTPEAVNAAMLEWLVSDPPARPPSRLGTALEDKEEDHLELDDLLM